MNQSRGGGVRAWRNSFAVISKIFIFSFIFLLTTLENEQYLHIYDLYILNSTVCTVLCMLYNNYT